MAWVGGCLIAIIVHHYLCSQIVMLSIEHVVVHETWDNPKDGATNISCSWKRS